MKHIREFQKLLEAKGGTLMSIERTRHFQIVVAFDGVEVRGTLSVSPSDHRTLLNLVCDLRRLAKQRKVA